VAQAVETEGVALLPPIKRETCVSQKPAEPARTLVLARFRQRPDLNSLAALET